jgi:hypothetical protein
MDAMRKTTLLAATILVLLGQPVLAQSSGDAVPTRVVGTVEKLDGDALTVAGKDGGKQTVVLSADAKVYGVEKRRFSDVKAGDFIASGGVRGTDGKIHAVELRIFPESLRGVGEGQRPWAVRPEGVMTNATVGTVSQAGAGGGVRVKYQGGESEFEVGPDVPVLAYVLADRTLLKPGAAILTIASKKPDGSLTANRVTAEKDGVKPPM